MLRRCFRHVFYTGSVVVVVAVAVLASNWPPAWYSLIVIGPIIVVGLHDSLQRRRTILRNFPVVGHIRYLMEEFRTEIQQYFIESDIEALPIEREFRSVIYQRAKGELETRPFGTMRNVYGIGYEWAGHSMAPRPPLSEAPRVNIGGPDCSRPYSASLLHISAMSFGALSSAAVRALNAGARAGGFAHNTGEGGVSEHHLAPGGDLIWQIGTGYFGCRDQAGRFDPGLFREQAAADAIRMIEVKLSQGAKPGHGGILPAAKVTPEIARARRVPAHQTVYSPPAHSAFDSPLGLLEFLARLREMAGGKPVGFKLAVGQRTDVLAVCKAMVESGITPDFISVDGGEGGTGAAPLEFSNSLGMPARDAWSFVHTALVGAGVRDRIRVVASGKILTGFHMVRALALGADVCATARGAMLALGCIQSLQCNSNKCPTGITTQNPALIYGLDVTDKAERVRRFHAATVHSALELIGAMGLGGPDEVRPHHVFRRIDDLRVRHLGELYDHLGPGELLGSDVPEWIAAEWQACRSDRWTPAPEPAQYRATRDHPGA